MFRIIQYVGALVGGILLFYLEIVASNYSLLFCLALILFFGVPHGAVDHKIHQSTSNQKSLSRYIIKYLLISLGYVFWWLLDPAKALFIFFILSVYHFGQELLEDTEIKDSNLINSLIWGSLILIAPIFFDLDEINPYIEIVTGYSIEGITANQSFYVVMIIYLIVLINLIYLYFKNKAEVNQLFRLLSFIAINTIIHLAFDFVIAFTIYFVFFHSLNAFKHQYQWLSVQDKNYNLKKFIRDLLGFSLLAIFGITVLLWIIKPETQASLITLFFIIISLITLPHALTLDQFYKFKSRSVDSNPSTIT